MLMLCVLADLFGSVWAAGDKLPLSFQLECDGFGLERQAGAPKGSPSWLMDMGFLLKDTHGWSGFWHEEGKARVTVTDSTGRSCSDVVGRERSDLFDGFGGIAFVPQRWLPSRHAQWVMVQGKVSLIASRLIARSEPVTLKLVKGFSVPVVLKRGGLKGDVGKGSDVRGTLRVDEYADWDVKMNVSPAGFDGSATLKSRLSVRLVTDEPIGLVMFHLMTGDGKPLEMCEGFFDDGKQVSDNRGEWWQNMGVPEVKEGEIKAQVFYGEDPRRVTARVDSRVGLGAFSLSEEEWNRRDAEGKKAVQLPGQGTNEESPYGQPVTVELAGLRFQRDDPSDRESPMQEQWRWTLSVNAPYSFIDDGDTRVQELEVEDSTGKGLGRLAIQLWRKEVRQEQGVTVAVVREAKRAVLPAPGAEWLRLKGILKAPVAVLHASPVHELLLVEGAALDVPIPGMDEEGHDVGDVATAGDAPACKLRLEQVKRLENRQVQFMIGLVMEGEETARHVEGFEFVDEQGMTLKADHVISHRMNGFLGQAVTIGNAGNMKKLRVRLKYRTDEQVMPIPVDVKVGLGGPVPQETDEKRR